MTLRFVVAHVRDESGKAMAQGLLLTNVATDVRADMIATWYYWRWRIETFHKLLKSAGLQVEQRQQESASAISKRLVIACMACVVSWQLQRQKTPAAAQCQKLLMDLSGRQTKRKRRVTTSGLLAGLPVLLMLLGVLQRYTPDELRAIAKSAYPPPRTPSSTGRPFGRAPPSRNSVFAFSLIRWDHTSGKERSAAPSMGPRGCGS